MIEEGFTQAQMEDSDYKLTKEILKRKNSTKNQREFLEIEAIR